MKDPHSYQRRTSVLVIASAITTALALFGVFRFTADILSVSWIGVWSLIQGLLLVARISDSGAGVNITRVIAVRVKNNEQIDLRNLSVAALVVASFPSVVLAIIITPIIGLYVASRFGGELDRSAIWTLVWIALLNAIFSAIANILLAICEGMFELNYKSIVTISSNLSGLVVAVPLISSLGPVGIGCVYLVMSLVQLGLSASRVRQLSRCEPLSDRCRIFAHIRVIWAENLNLSAIALIRLSFEPATKLMLSFFAPLVLIAQFELALRVTTQTRVIIQSGLQPLLAVGARNKGDTDSELLAIFDRNDRLLILLALGGVFAQIFAAPSIQWLGLGYSGSTFVILFSLLAVGNALNIVGLSGYYWQLTGGQLIRLLRIQGVMAAINITLGAIATGLNFAIGVIAAYAAAFAFGGMASRAYLPAVTKSRMLLAPLVFVSSGAIATALVVYVRPGGLIGIVGYLGAAMLFGGLTVYLLYRTSRRTR
ncbi:hypothetical protein [Mycobacterium sp. C31M]